MELLVVDGKWTEVYPTKFLVKHYSKQITGEDKDQITVEYNDGELSLFGEVSDFKTIVETILQAIQKKNGDSDAY